MRELAEEIARLGAAARDRKLKMEELTGGTFTITSLGPDRRPVRHADHQPPRGGASSACTGMRKRPVVTRTTRSSSAR